MCLHGVIATEVETLRARVNYNMERDASKFCSEWTLADTGNNGSGELGLSTDEEIQWDRDNGVFIKSTTCSKCLINLLNKPNTKSG